MRNIARYPFSFEGEPYNVSISCGITEVNANSASSAALWELADEGCLASKENGRNQVTLITPDST